MPAGLSGKGMALKAPESGACGKPEAPASPVLIK